MAKKKTWMESNYPLTTRMVLKLSKRKRENFMKACHELGAAIGKTADPVVSTKPADAPAPTDIDSLVSQMLIDNPGMSATTFLNLLKSKGFLVMPKPSALPAGKQASKPAKQADSGSSNVAQLRKQEAGFKTTIRCRMVEGAASDNGMGYSKFRVILLQEGLGNLRDAFYYTPEALASGVQLFEGKKIYANHPGVEDEKNRPERDVRDIIGHFEDVKLEETKDGTHVLTANACTVKGAYAQWARDQMSHAVEFSKKYPDKDFVGLSINASGDAEAKSVEEFLKETTIPETARTKLEQAVASDGLTEVRPVSRLTDAVSVDLVTEAGAGGKVTQLLEEKKMPAEKDTKKKIESEKKKEDEGVRPDDDTPEPGVDKKKKGVEAEDEGADQGDAKDDHADADQDKELIKKMVKDHLGDEHAEDEAVLKHAKGVYEAMKKEGYEGDEAVKHAGAMMKCAKRMHAESEESKEDESESDESEKESEKKETEKKENEKKESARELKLVGENARLIKENKTLKLAAYLDKKLKETAQPNEITKKMRDLIGEPRDEKHIDTSIKLFMEGFGAKPKDGSSDAGEDNFLMTEKAVKAIAEGEGAADFSDCIEE